jgi:hypothetical protein
MNLGDVQQAGRRFLEIADFVLKHFHAQRQAFRAAPLIGRCVRRFVMVLIYTWQLRIRAGFV